MTAPRLAEAVLRVVFLPDGRLELHGRLHMECAGKTIRLDCAPDEVMDLYETTASAIAEAARKERGEEEQLEPEMEAEPEPEPEPELPFTPGFSMSSFDGTTPPANLDAPALAPVVPLRPRPAQRVVTDEAGNPVLSRTGIDAASVVVAVNPGENGVDLL